MNTLTLALVLFSVFLSVMAQILLKMGMSSGSVQSALSGGVVSAVSAILTNVSVMLGLATYFSSAVVWLLVLSKIDVSKAYPFVGLGFVGTMLFAYWFLGEPLTISKVAGTLIIVVGVYIVSQ
jgi:multidrug transporter EmrE-like cation transporter